MALGRIRILGIGVLLLAAGISAVNAQTGVFPPASSGPTVTIDTDATLAGNSDSTVPSQRAAKAYTDQNILAVQGNTGGSKGYAVSQIVSGCGVEYTSGLSFTVGACTYTINGTTYTSPLSTKTLTAANGSNDRIDVIGVDTSGAVFTVAGTPGVSPSQPTIDATTQLQITFVYVPAAATTPQNVTTDNLYDENSEWALSTTAHLANSTSNPYLNTHDVEATNAVLGNNFTLVKPASGTIDLSTRNTLVFYIRSKAAWPTGTSGGTAARYLSLWWQNGSTQKGLQVVLRDGQFGFSSSNTTSYQQISIPTSLFGANGIAVTTLVVQVSGASGSSNIGFYVDDVTLQGGQNGPSLPTTLMNFRGAWSSTTAYLPNDMVTSGNIAYVAKVANTNIAVSTSVTWSALGTADSRATMWHDESTVLSGSALTTTITTSQPYAFYSTQSSPANGDSFTQGFYVNAGTYTLYAMGTTDTNRAKIDWYVDNVLVGSGQDWYASNQFGIIKSVPSISLTAGYHVLKGVANGKNASSSNYYMVLTKMWLKQSAD